MMTAATSMPTCLTMDCTTGFTDALAIRDRNITLESSFMLGSVYSIAHDNLDYSKIRVCECWVVKNLGILRAHKNGTHCCGFDT